MSKMTDFYAKVMADKTMQARVSEILGKTEITAASDEQLTAIGRLAKEIGFSISLAEAKEYIAAGEFDLGDEALGDIAGGARKHNQVVCIGDGTGAYERADGTLVGIDK